MNAILVAYNTFTEVLGFIAEILLSKDTTFLREYFMV